MSSQLPEAGLALMRTRAAYSKAESLREGAALVHSSRPRMSQAAEAGVMAGSKAGSAKCAARERRSHRHVSPEPFARPSSRRRGVHPGGLVEGWRVVSHECRPEGPHRALLRADSLVVRTAASRGEPGEQPRFILKCFDDTSGAMCARVGTGWLPVSLRDRQAA